MTDNKNQWEIESILKKSDELKNYAVVFRNNSKIYLRNKNIYLTKPFMSSVMGGVTN